MQKSTVNASQGGSGVEVIVGVMDGTVVGGGDGDVAVGMIFVFTCEGVADTNVFAQDTRNINRKRFKIRFISDTLESASLLAIFWSLSACRRICKALCFGKSLKYTIPMDDFYKTSLHNPPHYFVPNAMYIVTGAILYNHHLLIENSRKEFFLQTLFERTKLLGWGLQAWSILNNHYHFIAQAPQDATTLEKLIRQIHSITAIEFNRWDNTRGRQVWFNYWDSCLTYEKSYLARLHYVHMNPVKHGLSHNAMDYPFCSYKWFVEQGDEVLKQQVFAQPIDRVKIIDDF